MEIRLDEMNSNTRSCLILSNDEERAYQRGSLLYKQDETVPFVAPYFVILNLRTTTMCNKNKIRKIHFIWFGRELPQKYATNINTFVKLNPEYEVTIYVQKGVRRVTRHVSVL